MGSINIGFTDSRNSSRILKPPGGDTSDIFGVRELKKVEEQKLKQKEVEKPEVFNGNAKTEIEPEKEQPKSCEEVAPTEPEEKENVNGKNEKKEEKVEENKKNSEEKENTDKIGDNNEKIETPVKEKHEKEAQEKVPENIKDILTEKPQTNGTVNENEDKTNGAVKRPKNRIPPGGYSSGLW